MSRLHHLNKLKISFYPKVETRRRRKTFIGRRKKTSNELLIKPTNHRKYQWKYIIRSVKGLLRNNDERVAEYEPLSTGDCVIIHKSDPAIDKNRI